LKNIKIDVPMNSRIALLYDEKLQTIPKDKDGNKDWEHFWIELNQIIKR